MLFLKIFYLHVIWENNSQSRQPINPTVNINKSGSFGILAVETFTWHKKNIINISSIQLGGIRIFWGIQTFCLEKLYMEIHKDFWIILILYAHFFNKNVFTSKCPDTPNCILPQENILIPTNYILSTHTFTTLQ